MPALYCGRSCHLASLRVAAPCYGPGGHAAHDGHFAMPFASDHTVLVERLQELVRASAAPTAGLFAKILTACTRISLGVRSARIAQLVEIGAWTEAALALIEKELPGWTLRRLSCASGEWHCSLSQRINLPEVLDTAADGRHETMVCAILLAFLEASRTRIDALPVRTVAAVPSADSAAGALICCDNFA